MESPRPTPMFAFARLVLVLDLIAVVGAGLQLFGLSAHTDEYFAWTIKAPVTAARARSGLPTHRAAGSRCAATASSTSTRTA